MIYISTHTRTYVFKTDVAYEGGGGEEEEEKEIAHKVFLQRSGKTIIIIKI